MMDEQELITRMAVVETPPTALAVDDLVRAGRRRAFRRRATGATGGIAVLAVAVLAIPLAVNRVGAHQGGSPMQPAAANATTSPSPTAASCRMSTLPVPAGQKDVGIDAIDPTGHYIVGHALKGQDFVPILWTDGQPQVLPVHGKSVELSGVNASGVVTGTVTDVVLTEEKVFRYANGTITFLHNPAGHWHSYPVPAINAAGDVVVNIEPVGNSGGAGSKILLWRAGQKTPEILPLPTEADAFTITDDGHVVGGTYADGLGKDAYLWDLQGNGRKLETPAGQTAIAQGARGDWVVGGYWPSQAVALWNLRTGTVTTVPDAGPGEKVNIDGWVVASGSVFRDGVKVQLPVSDGHAAAAVDVSDTGLIVGVEDELGPRSWQC